MDKDFQLIHYLYLKHVKHVLLGGYLMPIEDDSSVLANVARGVV